MRVLITLPAAALIGALALPAGADAKPHRGSKCGKVRQGYEVIFDGSRRCFQKWRYTGGASMTLQRDGTVRSGPGEPGLGVLWYKARPYGDFSLRLQFRDDSPDGGARANSGVQVRFPAPKLPIPASPWCTPSNGDPAWVSVNCGHEIQINDNEDGDPRKTGSIYGFADLGIEAAKPTPRGTWNDLELTVIGQRYTVTRNGEQINEFLNLPDLPFPGRPEDPGSNGRGLVGYVGLQAHGAPQDVVSFRNVRIRDLSAE
jgi:Domain of Unknown Function (DUF1080)